MSNNLSNNPHNKPEVPLWIFALIILLLALVVEGSLVVYLNLHLAGH